MSSPHCGVLRISPWVAIPSCAEIGSDEIVVISSGSPRPPQLKSGENQGPWHPDDHEKDIPEPAAAVAVEYLKAENLLLEPVDGAVEPGLKIRDQPGA